MRCSWSVINDDCRAGARERQRCVSTFDGEIEESKLIECSLSFDCCPESYYHSDNSLSMGRTSSFREENDPIFGEN